MSETRELCRECGGNGVVKIPGGISVCPRCNQNCWDPEAQPTPPAETCRARARIVGYDIANGYERIGFAIGERVFWTGCAGSGMPSGSFDADQRLAEEIVRRWNAASASATDGSQEG